MIRLLIRFLTFPIRVFFRSVRLGWRTGRVIGPTRAMFFGFGFTTGVVIASPTARRAVLKGAVTGVAAIRESRTPSAPPPTTVGSPPPIEPAAPSGT